MLKWQRKDLYQHHHAAHPPRRKPVRGLVLAGITEGGGKGVDSSGHYYGRHSLRCRVRIEQLFSGEKAACTNSYLRSATTIF